MVSVGYGRVDEVSVCYSLGQKARGEADKTALAGGILRLYPVVSVGVCCFCKMDCQQRRKQCNCKENYFLGKIMK